MVQRPVVLVTGSARRLGRLIALDLAAQGWDVAVHCHGSRQEGQETVALLRERGARAELFVADLADEAATRALAAAAIEHFGRLDAVVNNASLFEHDTAQTFGHAAMERHWRTNTAAPVLLAQALHRHLCERGEAARGCVVNLLDQKLWNPNPDHLSYTLSKAALESATTLLALALAPVLRVAGVAPGITLPAKEMDERHFAAVHAMTPLGRSSTADDIVRAVRFIIETPSITGTTLLVDGGQHLARQARDVLFLSPSKSD